MDESIVDGVIEDHASSLNNSQLTTTLTNGSLDVNLCQTTWIQCNTDIGEIYYLNCASGNNNSRPVTFYVSISMYYVYRMGMS